MNEKLIKDVTLILDTFAQEELHNRLSQFSMLSLKSAILNFIMNYKPEEGKEKDDKTVSK